MQKKGGGREVPDYRNEGPREEGSHRQQLEELYDNLGKEESSRHNIRFG